MSAFGYSREAGNVLRLFYFYKRSTLVQLRARDDAANITGVRRLIASEHSEGCSAYSDAIHIFCTWGGGVE